jgi:hypothetical protein
MEKEIEVGTVDELDSGDELDFGDQLPSLAAISDEVLDARMIAVLRPRGLTDYRAADPAVSEEEDGDGRPETEDESGAVVVGHPKPSKASKRRKPSEPGNLSEFEEALKLNLATNPRLTCSAERAIVIVREVRAAVLSAQGIIKNRCDASPPVSCAKDLKALFNTELLLAHLATLSRSRAKGVLGSILCALIFNRDTPETIVAEESAVADSPRTCQELINIYTREHRVARNAVVNSNEPSKAQKENWVAWERLAAAAVDLATQVTSDMAERERGSTKIDPAQLNTLLELGIMCVGVLHMPPRYSEMRNMWITTDEKKADDNAKNWVVWTPGTSGDDSNGVVFTYFDHKGKDSGHLGDVRTSPTQACFAPFRNVFGLYAAQLYEVTGLPEHTSIPLFFDAKAYVKENILRPMNEEQLANMYFAVTDRYVGKRIGCRMLRTIFASYHARGLDPDSDARGVYPASGLTIEEVALAMLHSYETHKNYYILEVQVPN